MKRIDQTVWLKYEPQLRTFVRSKVKDQELAHDIVQDVFLRVTERLDSLKNEEKLLPWIYRIANNLIADHFRRESKPLPVEKLQPEKEPSNYNECLAQCVQETLQEIPEKYREALELTTVGNLSQLQLADRLRISYSGAKSRVQRARDLVRQKIDEKYKMQLDAYGNAIACGNRLPCGCE